MCVCVCECVCLCVCVCVYIGLSYNLLEMKFAQSIAYFSMKYRAHNKTFCENIWQSDSAEKEVD